MGDQEIVRRVCPKTGLALVSSPASAFRIARHSLGALNPLKREPNGDCEAWSRYDTVGRTIYARDDKLTAYLELLAPYQTEVDNKRKALQPVADLMGVPIKELWRDVVNEWDEAGMMRASWLPRVFREGRALYMLEFPSGWWVDLTAAETIAALEETRVGGFQWPTAQGPLSEPLTLSHITSDDRILTTAIATFLRENVGLDDGTLPLGVQFLSKRGKPHRSSGLCWAYWMREVDLGLKEPARVSKMESIVTSDPDFVEALKLCRIKSR